MERVPHHPGRKPKFSGPIRELLRGWLRRQPDSTLSQLQEKLAHQKQLWGSVPALWVVLGEMGLRLKKSHSTRKSATRKPSGRGDQGFGKSSTGSRRKS